MDARVVEWVVRNAVGECVGSEERVEGERFVCSSHPPLGALTHLPTHLPTHFLALFLVIRSLTRPPTCMCSCCCVLFFFSAQVRSTSSV